MSMALRAAINKVQAQINELEKDKLPIVPMDYSTIYNQFSEMAARIEELEHRIQVLEAKRKPGRPRKDER